jgi:Arc/MetJ-type ribon-helix-helix transcriptional regulator
MTTSESLPDTVSAWFTGRLPEEWRRRPPQISIDREEITVLVELEPVDLDNEPSDEAVIEAAAGRIAAWREETRETRMQIARETERRFGRKVSWGARSGSSTLLFTHLAVPAMTRLRQPQRQVLDTLVEAGVARSRSDALAWCVRLVEQHNEEWLSELREAMDQVHTVRSQGPTSG